MLFGGGYVRMARGYISKNVAVVGGGLGSIGPVPVLNVKGLTLHFGNSAGFFELHDVDVSLNVATSYQHGELTCTQSDLTTACTPYGGGVFVTDDCGGGAFYGGGIHDNNESTFPGDPGRSSQITNNNRRLSYVMPAPIGSFVRDGVTLCTDASCHRHSFNAPYFSCPAARCDVSRLNNTNVSVLPTTQINYPVPDKCEPGFDGSRVDNVSQATALCAGLCAAGLTCADPSQPQPVPRGFYSARGQTSPSPCSSGMYGKENGTAGTRISLEKACITCPESFTTLRNGSSSCDECICLPHLYLQPKQNASPEYGSKCPFLRDHTCSRCPIGTFCDDFPGVTTAKLRLLSGYWRISNATNDVRPCPVRVLCVGDVNRTLGAYCADHLDSSVPYCSRCRHYPDEYLDVSTGLCE